MKKIEPLSWPNNWENGLPKRKLSRFGFGKIPPFGVEYKVEKHIQSQLLSRAPEVCLSLWGNDETRLNIYREFCDIIKHWFKWKNQNFIPDDPFQIIFFDATGFHVDDARDDAFLEMKKKWHITYSDIQGWNSLTLSKVIDNIKDKL